MSSRVHWSNSSEKTLMHDQFRVDLWEPVTEYEEIKLVIECQMVVCEVNAFAQAPIDQTICKE